MNHVAQFKGGKLVRYFALALFAGIRPGGELEKLAEHPGVDRSIEQGGADHGCHFENRAPTRQIKIRENLHRWLTQFPGEILPVNSDRGLKSVRKKFPNLVMIFCAIHSFRSTSVRSNLLRTQRWSWVTPKKSFGRMTRTPA